MVQFGNVEMWKFGISPDFRFPHSRFPDFQMRSYFDHNATTPPDPAVIEAVVRALAEDFGNASSVHHFGQRAKALLDDARSAVADLIGAEPAEVVFTSGGTEAD